MPTDAELAQDIVNKLVKTRDQKEINNILGEVNSFIYVKTKESISQEKKIQILKLVYGLLQGVVFKQFDNTNYLELVSHMIQQLSEGKK